MPWGLDDVVGTVSEVFGPEAEPFVRVIVQPPGFDPDDEAVVVPIRMSAVREAPNEAVTHDQLGRTGTIEVVSAGLHNNRLGATVFVRGLGKDRAIEVWLPRDETTLVIRQVGVDAAQRELAKFAISWVAQILERGGTPDAGSYMMSAEDAQQLVQRAHPT